jgi:hypothetical protein
MVLSKDSEKCKQCEQYNECNNKRMELCAYIAPTIAAPSTSPLALDLIVKHDCRDIKIAENTTVTIDVEELKKNLENEIYKSFGCSFLREG